MMTESKLDNTMHVTDIEISDLHFSYALRHHLASVSMTMTRDDAAAPVHIHLLCRSEQPEDCPEETVTRDLVDDGLRQARRMPGFRRGERQIEVDISKATLIKRAASA